MYLYKIRFSNKFKVKNYCRSQTLQKYSFGWAVDILKREFRHNKS